MKAILRLIGVTWCAIFIVVPSIWYVLLVTRLIHTPFVSADPARELGKVNWYLYLYEK